MPGTKTFNNNGIVLCDITASTNGSGLWSTEERKVHIHKMKFKPYVYTKLNDSHRCEEEGVLYVEAYFYIKNWNTDKYGLIYTDQNWIKEFRKKFYAMFPKLKAIDSHIDYTEQGMQGHNYVSLVMYVDSNRIKKFKDFIANTGIDIESE